MRLTRRRRWLVLAPMLLVVLAGLGLGGNVLGRYLGWTVARVEPAALSARLRPYYRIATPPGPGPFPTALLYSGCDGPKDNMARWSDALVAHGWAAIVVDSHAPRGLGERELWRLVCAGQLFLGSERAGDVLVSLDDARHMPFVDPARLVPVGASHGGWAIMDLLALDPPRGLPANLRRAPEGGLAGVIGTILVYPYCGTAARAYPGGWPEPIPALFLLVERDAIAPPERCLEIAAALRARGTRAEVVELPGTTHGFDQETKAAFSTLEFDPAATETAIAAALAFLDGLAQNGQITGTSHTATTK